MKTQNILENCKLRLILCCVLFAAGFYYNVYCQIIIDHTCTDISAIPQSAIENAKENLHIVYSHTSHGSHITYGMNALVDFMNDKLVTQGLYAWSEDGTADGNDSVLYLRDFHTVSSTPVLFNGVEVAEDVMFPRTSAHILADRKNWANDTRSFLNSEYAAGVNVLVWAWCGGVTGSSEAQIQDNYLLEMDSLEREFPHVKFVYMTGHVDAGITNAYGQVNEQNLIERNQQIRDYCIANKKILYDFADIESYDPDGNYYGEKHVDDGCNYDANGNDTLETDGGDPGNPVNGDANWAIDWQISHIQWNGSNGDVAEWFSCGTTHSQAINGNQKAYSVWHLWARLAGWGVIDSVAPTILSVSANDNPTEVDIVFSEIVSSVSAEDISNYQISQGIMISNASLNTDNRTVTLTTTDLTDGITYTITINNIQDLSGNSILDNSQDTFVFNHRPVLSSIPDQIIDEGQEVSFLITASDTDGDNIILTANNLPDEAVFTDNGDGTASFSWQTSIGDATPTGSPIVVTFIANDGNVDSDVLPVNIIINDIVPPTIESINVLSKLSIKAVFSENIVVSSGQYSIDNGIVIDSTLFDGERSIILNLDSNTCLEPEIQYTLTVNGINDLSENTILENSQITFFYYPVDLTDGLQGYWKFDEGSGIVANDSSGYNRHANLENGAYYFNDPERGLVVYMDGVDDYVDLGTYNFGMDVTNEFSLCFWVNILREGYQVILQKGPYTYPFGICRNTDGRLRISIRTIETQTAYIYSEDPLTLEQWYHVVLTYGNGTVNLFVDNVIDDEELITGTLSLSGNTYIGNRPEAQYYIQAKIDEVRIYNRELSNEEIYAIYNEIAGAPDTITEIIEIIETNDLNYKVYPNPASSILIIESNNGRESIFELFNLSGMKMLEQSINTKRQMIDISGLSKGVYLFRIIKKNNNTYIGMLLINR